MASFCRVVRCAAPTRGTPTLERTSATGGIALAMSDMSATMTGVREMDVMAMARDERTEMADFLASLRSEQWDQPSLCVGWRIRDVAAHVVSYEEHGGTDLIKRVAKARFRPGRLNEVALVEYAARDPQELVEFLRNHLTPRGATARFGG